MSSIRLLLTVIAVATFVTGCDAPTQKATDTNAIFQSTETNAERILEGAQALAKSRNQKLLVKIGATWCPACNILSDVLAENESFFAGHFVIVKIDTDTDGGAIVAERLRKGRGNMIPWMVILDEEGRELATSDSPAGNIGCPVTEATAEYFVGMLQDSDPSFSGLSANRLQMALVRYGEKL